MSSHKYYSFTTFENMSSLEANDTVAVQDASTSSAATVNPISDNQDNTGKITDKEAIPLCQPVVKNKKTPTCRFKGCMIRNNLQNRSYPEHIELNTAKDLKKKRNYSD